MEPFCVDNCYDFDRLRKLDQRLANIKFELLVVTKEKTIRGTNFRAKKIGIILIVAKLFRSNRDLD